jgi:hypothetical protein
LPGSAASHPPARGKLTDALATDGSPRGPDRQAGSPVVAPIESSLVGEVEAISRTQRLLLGGLLVVGLLPVYVLLFMWCADVVTVFGWLV